MLSDSDSDEDYHNIEVDPGVLDHPEDLLDPRIPAAMGGLSDEPDSRFSIMTGRSKDSMMPFPWRGNVELLNMNVSQVKDERSRSRLESDAPASLGWQSRSRKRKDRDDVHEEHRTDILFGEGKRTHTYGFVPEEQVLPSRASLSWSRGALDAQAFVPAPSGTPACVKLEDAYQSEQNAVWLSGDHRHEKHASTFNYGSRYMLTVVCDVLSLFLFFVSSSLRLSRFWILPPVLGSSSQCRLRIRNKATVCQAVCCKLHKFSYLVLLTDLVVIGSEIA